jgi:protein ImuA
MSVVSLPAGTAHSAVKSGDVNVIPGCAGIQKSSAALDSRFRGSDGRGVRANPALIAALRRRIEAIERPAPCFEVAPVLAIGAAAVDRALPGGGLAPAALHEIQGGGAATAFAAALAARRLDQGVAGPVLWCRAAAGLYPPGLAGFGLEADRLILVRGRNDRELLWALEEGLVSGRLAVVVGEVRRLDLTASRRLQLAAEAGGGMALLLRPDAADGASAALTRWRLESAPSGPASGHPGVGAVRLWARLVRCRGGAVGDWLLEWDDATHTFNLAAVLGDRPAHPRPRAARA